MRRNAHIRNLLASSYRSSACLSNQVFCYVGRSVGRLEDKSRVDALLDLPAPRMGFIVLKRDALSLFGVNIPSQTAKGKWNPGLVLMSALYSVPIIDLYNARSTMLELCLLMSSPNSVLLTS
jgi:hypothetical protein